jgi:DHHC palmitoyltransferase
MSNKKPADAPSSSHWLWGSWLCKTHTVSLIMYFLFSLHLIGFVIPLLWSYEYVMPIVATSYAIITIVLSIAIYLTCTINPVDDAVYTNAALTRTPEYGSRISYCHACKVDVHSSSRHCRYCDKCILGFDHHCVW